MKLLLHILVFLQLRWIFFRALTLYQSIHKQFPENAECLRYLVRLCGDLGMREAQDYVMELKKLERTKEVRERVNSSRPGNLWRDGMVPKSHDGEVNIKILIICNHNILTFKNKFWMFTNNNFQYYVESGCIILLCIKLYIRISECWNRHDFQLM